MQWLRDGIQLYDSGPQEPAFFLEDDGGSGGGRGGGATFRDGNTFWRAGITKKQAVVLATNRIRSVDAGRYTCRIYIGPDIYESSGRPLCIFDNAIACL